MNRPGYDKYITKINDEVKEINLDKIVKKHITKNGDGIDSMNGKSALQVDEHEFLGELKWVLGNELDSYLKENTNELLKVLDKNKVESLESQNDIIKNKVVQVLMSKYKYLVAFKDESQGGAVFTSATLANKVANDIIKNYDVGKEGLVIKGFTLKITDAANEDDTILKAIEKDVLGHVQKGIIEFYNFNNLDKLDDRSPQFLEQFKNTINKNKDKIKNIIQKTNCSLIHIQKEYVKKSDLELFTFIQKNLGFKFYVKYYKDVYISNDLKEIKKLLDDIYTYGEATSTNVK